MKNAKQKWSTSHTQNANEDSGGIAHSKSYFCRGAGKLRGNDEQRAPHRVVQRSFLLLLPTTSSRSVIFRREILRRLPEMESPKAHMNEQTQG